MKICILGASGCIGLEIVAELIRCHLREIDCIVAVMRNGDKLMRGLEARGISCHNDSTLKVIEGDLFAPGEYLVEMAVAGSDIVVNCASPSLSWNPFSEINHTLGTPVSNLTSKIIYFGQQQHQRRNVDKLPKIIVFCGPEYFESYDGPQNISTAVRCFSWLGRFLYPALQDNSDEVLLLLDSDYPSWTVFRCGSTRPHVAGNPVCYGDARKIASDLHKDHSNYSVDKGYSLRAIDLGAFVAEYIVQSKSDDFRKEMPFVWNQRLWVYLARSIQLRRHCMHMR